MRLFRRDRRRTVPAEVSQVSTAWLTQVMTDAGALAPTARVASYTAEPLDDRDASTGWQRTRLRLTHDPADAGPPSVIAKLASADPLVCAAMEAHDSYRREIFFHRDLAPLIQIRIPDHLGSDIEQSDGADRSGPVGPFGHLPARLQIALAPENPNVPQPTGAGCAVLLEDLGDDAVTYDAEHPPPVELIRVGLDTLAHLHGAFWHRRDTLEGHPALGRLFTRSPELLAPELRMRTFELARQRWAAWSSPADTVAMLMAASSLVADVELVNTPMTLLHGEPHSQNLVYSASESQPPALIGWHTAAFGHPGWDVAFLLGTSLHADEAAAAGELIGDYHRILVDLDCPISESELRAGVRAALRVQLLQNVLGVRATPNPPTPDTTTPYDWWTPRVLALLRTR